MNKHRELQTLPQILSPNCMQTESLPLPSSSGKNQFFLLHSDFLRSRRKSNQQYWIQNDFMFAYPTNCYQTSIFAWKITRKIFAGEKFLANDKDKDYKSNYSSAARISTARREKMNFVTISLFLKPIFHISQNF